MRRVLVCGIFVLMVSRSLAAQTAEVTISGRRVTTSGTATIVQPPSRMRMYVDLVVREADMESAASVLKDHQESLKAQLIELGAVESSIAASEMRVYSALSAKHVAIDRILRQQSGSFTVYSRMTAEWDLSAKHGDALLSYALPLQKKILDADLVDLEFAQQLAEEESEAIDVMNGQTSAMISADVNAFHPGELVFVYLAPIPEEDLSEARKIAFEKAKTSATRLAEAAGQTLGPLQSLSEEERRPDVDRKLLELVGMMTGFTDLEGNVRALIQESRGPDAPLEAFSREPGPIKHTICIEASFELAD